MIKRYIHNNKLLAIKFDISKEPFLAVTEEGLPLQISTINKKSGAVVPTHFHKPLKRETQSTGECMVVISGKIQVSLFDKNGARINRAIVCGGQGFVTFHGSHEIKFIEDAKIIEFKNGPYVQDRINQ